jgi:hypothetical protein
MKEKALNIVGLYFWGKGMSSSVSEMFDTVVEEFAKGRLEIKKTNFGVYNHKSDNLDIYFHPMETVFKGEKNIVDEEFTKFKIFLEKSNLPLTLLTVKWEKLNGEYIKEF